MSPLAKKLLSTGVAFAIAVAGALITAAEAGEITDKVLLIAGCTGIVSAGKDLLAYLSAPPG